MHESHLSKEFFVSKLGNRPQPIQAEPRVAGDMPSG